MEIVSELLGIHSRDLTPINMACRAVIIFFLSLLLINIGGLRLLGKYSAFDQLTILILGAILGRSIVANTSFTGSIVAAVVIILLHRTIARLTFHYSGAGSIFKGKSIILWENKTFIHKNLDKTHITENDIMEAIRLKTGQKSFENIESIYLERSGEISIIKGEQGK